ncbi:uncharacterized protein PG986_011361 [Apiospora aurea]|uniref:Uncharacterized protein n=1 Tax=Apiospora aurea TaxID=335848 RepID=A0ABR1Q4W9_9PEZI
MAVLIVAQFPCVQSPAKGGLEQEINLFVSQGVVAGYVQRLLQASEVEGVACIPYVQLQVLKSLHQAALAKLEEPPLKLPHVTVHLFLALETILQFQVSLRVRLVPEDHREPEPGTVQLQFQRLVLADHEPGTGQLQFQVQSLCWPGNFVAATRSPVARGGSLEW